MLFSEPKIPQYVAIPVIAAIIPRFSALQRAENSSIGVGIAVTGATHTRFSALQRAENSSINRRGGVHDVGHRVSVLFSEPKIPQSFRHVGYANIALSFSALQRAENSSI